MAAQPAHHEYVLPTSTGVLAILAPYRLYRGCVITTPTACPEVNQAYSAYRFYLPINRQYRANETHQTRQFCLQYQLHYFVLKPFLTAPEWAGLDTVHHDCHLPNTQAHKFLLIPPILRPIYFQAHKSSRLLQRQYRGFAN